MLGKKFAHGVKEIRELFAHFGLSVPLTVGDLNVPLTLDLNFQG